MDRLILITGGHGGLGYALRDILQKAGYNNILAPRSTELNLLDKVSVSEFFNKNKPRVVFHLASLVYGLAGNLNNQLLSLEQNTSINNNLYTELVKSCEVEYIFHAGTVAAYGFPYKNLPLREDDFFDGLPHDGEFGYAMAKRHAYSYLKILGEQHNIKYTYGILTNLYGEYDKFDTQNGHVIPSIISKAYDAKKMNHPLFVWGDGKATRDFLHFRDAAYAIKKCFESFNETNLINISSGTEVSIKELAKIVQATAEIPELIFEENKPSGIPRRVVSNAQLKMLDFAPSITLDVGIKNLWEWFTNNINQVRK